MKVTFPYRLSRSSSDAEIATNLKALVDVLHHGLDRSNLRADSVNTASQLARGHALIPYVLTMSTAQNDILMRARVFSSGNAQLVATSIWQDGAASRIRIGGRAVGGALTYFHDVNPTADETHYTQFYTTGAFDAEGQDVGYQLDPVDGVVIAKPDATNVTIVAIAWVKMRLAT